jgi:F0F1-type ATP synthase delta subunit
MENAYAQAIWKAVENGKSPKEAVSAVVEMLKKQGRAELLPRIGRALSRLAAAKSANNARVFVAHERDAKEAFKQSGVDEADIIVDETLIGGWRLEDRDTLVDASFKKMLLDMYNRALA